MARRPERRYSISYNLRDGKLQMREGLTLEAAFVEWSRLMKAGKRPRMDRSLETREVTNVWGNVFVDDGLRTNTTVMLVASYKQQRPMMVGSST